MKVITSAEAASLLQDKDSVVVSGSGGGHCIPEKILEAVEQRYLRTQSPQDLCLIHVVGLGNRAEKGAARFAHPGMVKRSITSALIDSPVFIGKALKDEIESYTLPQGVLSQLMREMAGGRPGLICKTGLHTFVDPRQAGAKQSPSAKEDLVELMSIDGQEWLRFKPFPIDVAFLRGTTADEDGNISMEHEAIPGEMLSTAQATRRNGGTVVVQVKRLAQRNTISPRAVKIPGILVDYVVVDPEQSQTYATSYNAAYAGELRIPSSGIATLPLTPRKIIARRAAMELRSGAICNLGAGISTGIAAVAAEEGIADKVVLTNEQGFIGGTPLTGVDTGTAQNYSAMVDQPYQFDFYDGGGLDIAFLSFVEVDPTGNVNISRFGSKIVGIGGFVNISQNAKKVVFSGTFSAGGFQAECVDGRLKITSEGAHSKFVSRVEQISYSADFAREEGRSALFITERAVFELRGRTLELIEIAPGIELERDVLAHMEFRPRVSENLKEMDHRIFLPDAMGLSEKPLPEPEVTPSSRRVRVPARS